MPDFPTIEDFIDFTPLYPGETEDVILDRMRGWANEGLDPATAPPGAWTDTREGSHWYVGAMPAAREIARLYDLAGTEVVMAGMVLWTWGTYLDDQAQVQDLARLAATPSTGEVVFTGPPTTPIASGTQVGVDPATPDDPAPLYQTTTDAVIGGGGTVTVPVVAVEAGKAGKVGANAITAPSTPLPPGVTFTNPNPTVGGTDPETDEALRRRLMDVFAAGGLANDVFYRRLAEQHDGVGHANVITLWNGPNTILIVLTDPDGEPVSPAVVAEVQADIDPLAGRGAGSGEVGAIVTVKTATALPIAIGAVVEFELGYSLDGDAGTAERRSAIVAALDAYTTSVQSGGEVVIAQVEGRIVTVPGVHDVSGVTVNGGTVNVPVAAGTSPEIPVLSPAPALTEA